MTRKFRPPSRHTKMMNFISKIPMPDRLIILYRIPMTDRARYEELADPKYIDPGAIFDMMALTVIYYGLQRAKSARRQ